MKLELTKNKLELFLKTALWNSIIETFNREKNLDFSKYLISVNIRGNKLIVKTGNPILNAELLNLNEKIKEVFVKKIQNLEIKDFEIVYK